MTQLGLKSGGLNSLPHGVALIRISTKACGDVDEFYGVFFHGDYIDGRFERHDMAQLAFDELRCEKQQEEFLCEMSARA